MAAQGAAAAAGGALPAAVVAVGTRRDVADGGDTAAGGGVAAEAVGRDAHTGLLVVEVDDSGHLQVEGRRCKFRLGTCCQSHHLRQDHLGEAVCCPRARWKWSPPHCDPVASR